MIRTPARTVTLALALASLSTALPASAAITDGDAVSVCRKKIEQEFGADLRTKLVRLRSQTGFQVDLKVTGKDKAAFTAKC